jgi:predicted RNA-binding protein Jag
MVTLDQLKEFMRKKAEEDRAMKSIQVTGETLEEALKNAQIELGLPLKKIEYDILQKGNKGLFRLREKSLESPGVRNHRSGGGDQRRRIRIGQQG